VIKVGSLDGMGLVPVRRTGSCGPTCAKSPV
jgi:hypothetical protein